MRVDKLILNCAVFLCGKNEGEDYKIRGTAFAVTLEGGIQHTYFVTAKHCITRAKAKYSKLFFRLNKKDGSGPHYLEVPFDAWVMPDDPVTDVAVLPAPRAMPRYFEIATIPESMFATHAVIEEHEIGLGDAIIIVGLFSKREGIRRNVPIVRAGTIAALPDEPLYDHTTDLHYNGYLLEVRSTGGLSGSPVFAYLGYDRDGEGKVNRHGYDFLLGVVRGHWDYKPSESEDAAMDEREEIEAMNMGVAIATPFQEVINLLNSEDLVKERIEKERRKAQSDAPTLDWDDDDSKPGPEPERLKIDGKFEESVKRAMKKGKPPKEGGKV